MAQVTAVPGSRSRGAGRSPSGRGATSARNDFAARSDEHPVSESDQAREPGEKRDRLRRRLGEADARIEPDSRRIDSATSGRFDRGLELANHVRDDVGVVDVVPTNFSATSVVHQHKLRAVRCDDLEQGCRRPAARVVHDARSVTKRSLRDLGLRRVDRDRDAAGGEARYDRDDPRELFLDRYRRVAGAVGRPGRTRRLAADVDDVALLRRPASLHARARLRRCRGARHR